MNSEDLTKVEYFGYGDGEGWMHCGIRSDFIQFRIDAPLELEEDRMAELGRAMAAAGTEVLRRIVAEDE